MSGATSSDRTAGLTTAGTTEPRDDQPAPPGVGQGHGVDGASIGGNIDTTVAVSAAGAIVGEEDLQIATIVKTAA